MPMRRVCLCMGCGLIIGCWGLKEDIEFDDRAICGAVYGSGGAAGAVGEGLGGCRG